MIDTITLKVIITAGQSKHIASLITNRTDVHNFAFEKPIKTGFYKNLKVTLSDTKNETVRMKVSGSLTKFCLGNNLQLLPKNEIKHALKELSIAFGVNMFLAELSRVDIGRCFCLSYPVKRLLDTFLEDSRHKYYAVPGESKTYIKNNTTLVFYDKIKEMQRRGEMHPVDREKYKEHVLRYELQSTTGLCQQYGYRVLLGIHLLSSTFLQKLESNWRKSFFEIQRRPYLGYKFDKWNTKLVTEYFFVAGIEASGGVKAISDSVEDFWSEIEPVGPNDYYKKRYFREKVKHAYCETPFVRYPDLFEDIEKKIWTPFFKN